MKRLFLFICVLLALNTCAHSQNFVRQAPKGFDTLRADIPHGRVDTIHYASKTVGVTRKALIYTPPGFSADKKYPVLYILHGGGEDQ